MLNTKFITLAAVLGAACVCANARPLGYGDMDSHTSDALATPSPSPPSVNAPSISTPTASIPASSTATMGPTVSSPVSPPAPIVNDPANSSEGALLESTATSKAESQVPTAPALPSISANPTTTTTLAMSSPPVLIIYYSTDSSEGEQPTTTSTSESQVPTPAVPSITAPPAITTHIGGVGAGVSITTSADEPEPTSSDDEYPDEGRDEWIIPMRAATSTRTRAVTMSLRKGICPSTTERTGMPRTTTPTQSSRWRDSSGMAETDII
ncbi:hypothetical protein C8Q80DRAFT_1276293 [Daedaleopsis nitida]|nr:hypothetical protein C8Q80DRAFT_1276293 [Daedaleopsis nitida]